MRVRAQLSSEVNRILVRWRTKAEQAVTFGLCALVVVLQERSKVLRAGRCMGMSMSCSVQKAHDARNIESPEQGANVVGVVPVSTMGSSSDRPS